MRQLKTVKKCFTLAALFAAGTAFALADDETTDTTTDTSSVTIVDETNGGTTVVTQETIEATNTGLSTSYADYYLNATVVETTGTVSNFYITSDYTSTGDAYDVDHSSNDYATLLFKGTGTVSIAGIDIDTGTLTKSTSYNTITTYQALIVAENASVVIDGVTGTDGSVIELALNISVGTYPSGSEDADNFVSNVATLTISGGSKIETSAYYNVVGSNGQTGILNITGEGTEVYMQQTTVGANVAGLGSASTKASQGYYYPAYLQTEDAYDATQHNLDAGDSEINITDGATLYIGYGDATSSSRNKLQIRDGTVTVSGSDSQLIFGDNAALSMAANYGGVEYPDELCFVGKLVIEDGASVSVQTADGEQGTLAYLAMGQTAAADTNYSIDVTGEGSSFDIIADAVVIGSTYYDYGDYDSTVSISVSDGATASIESTSTLDIGYSESDGSTVNVSISVSGENSSLTLASESGTYANELNSDDASVSISVSDGATLTTEGETYLHENTTVTVGNDSDSTAESDATWSADSVYVYYGASVTVEDGGTLEATEIIADSNGESSVVVKSGGTLALSDTAYVVVGDAATFILEEDSTLLITISADTLESVTDGFIQIVSDDSSETEGTHTISNVNLVIVLDGVTLDDIADLVIIDSSVVETYSDTDVTAVFASITVDGESLDVASALSNSSGVITVAVPEPSAFGVLAGAFALAFAAARRSRRSRKA